jgi:hypothetical protein
MYYKYQNGLFHFTSISVHHKLLHPVFFVYFGTYIIDYTVQLLANFFEILQVLYRLFDIFVEALCSSFDLWKVSNVIRLYWRLQWQLYSSLIRLL